MSYNTALIEQNKKWANAYANDCLDFQDLYTKVIERMKLQGIPKEGPEWMEIFSHATFLATTVIAANVKKAEGMVDAATAKFEKTTGTPLDEKLKEMSIPELSDLMDKLASATGTMTYKKIAVAYEEKMVKALNAPKSPAGHAHTWFHVDGKIQGCACGATKLGEFGAEILLIAPVGIGKKTTDTKLKDEDTLFGLDVAGELIDKVWDPNVGAVKEPNHLTPEAIKEQMGKIQGQVISGMKIPNIAEQIATDVIANISKEKQKFVEFVETEVLDIVGDLNLSGGGSVTAHTGPGDKTIITLTINFDPKPDYLDGPKLINKLANNGYRITALKCAEGSMMHTLQIEAERMPKYLSEPDMAEEAMAYAKFVELGRVAALKQCEGLDEEFWGGHGVEVADKPVKTEQKKQHALFALNSEFYAPDWECGACYGSGGSGVGGPDGTEMPCTVCHGFPTVSDLKKEFTEAQITIMQKMWAWEKDEKTVQDTVQLGVDLAGGADDATVLFHFMGKKIEVIPSGDVVPKTPNGKDSLLIVDGEPYVGVNYHHEMKDKDGLETIHLKAQKIPVSKAVIEAVKKAGHLGLLGTPGAAAAAELDPKYDIDKNIMDIMDDSPALATKAVQEAMAKALAKSMDDKAEEEFMKAISNPEAAIANSVDLFKEIMATKPGDEVQVTINHDGSVTPNEKSSLQKALKELAAEGPTVAVTKAFAEEFDKMGPAMFGPGKSIKMGTGGEVDEYVPTDSDPKIASYGKPPHLMVDKAEGKAQYYADDTMHEGDYVFLSEQHAVTNNPSPSQVMSIGKACHSVLKGEIVWVKLEKKLVSKDAVEIVKAVNTKKFESLTSPKIYPPDVMIQVTSAEVDAAGLEMQTVIAGLSQMSFYKADAQTLFSFKCHELKFQFSVVLAKGDWVQVRRVQNTDGSNTYLVERMNGKVMVELITSQQVMGTPFAETKKVATLSDTEVAQGALKIKQKMAAITFTSDMQDGEIMTAGGHACTLSIMKQGQSIVTSTSSEGGTKKIFDLALGCSAGVHTIEVFMHKTYKGRNVYTLRYDYADQIHYEDVPEPGPLQPTVKGENAKVYDMAQVVFSNNGREIMKITQDGKIIVYADTYFAMNNKTVSRLADEFAKVFWQAIGAQNPMTKQAQESSEKYFTATKMIAKLQMIGNEKQGQIHTLAKELATIKAELAKPNHDQSKDPRKARFGNVASMLDLIEKPHEAEAEQTPEDLF